MADLSRIPMGLLADRDALPDAQLVLQEKKHRAALALLAKKHAAEVDELRRRVTYLEAKEADAFRQAIAAAAAERRFYDERRDVLEALHAATKAQSESKKAQMAAEKEVTRLRSLLDDDFEETVAAAVAAETKKLRKLHAEAIDRAYANGVTVGQAESRKMCTAEIADLQKQLHEAKTHPQLPTRTRTLLAQMRSNLTALCAESDVIPGPGRLVGRDRELMDGIEAAIKPVKEAPALGAATDLEDDNLEID